MMPASLRVSAVDDLLGREDDAVANWVMRMADPDAYVARARDERLQQKPAARQLAPGEAPAIVHEVLRSPGQPLDAATRAYFEPRFGRDFSGVRIHADASAAASALYVNAKAYAVGNDIVFSDKQFAPGTADGKRLLAHVVQQGQGPASFRAGADDAEREAQIASTSIDSGNAIRLQAATSVGLACSPADLVHIDESSVDEWLDPNGQLDLATMDYSKLREGINKINDWKDRQTSTSPEMLRLEQTLMALKTEMATRQAPLKSILKPGRSVRQDKRTSKIPAVRPAGPSPIVLLETPHTLTERRTLPFENPNEARAELDRIIAWLQFRDVSEADRKLLMNELPYLEQQFAQGQKRQRQIRHAAGIQAAITPAVAFTPTGGADDSAASEYAMLIEAARQSILVAQEAEDTYNSQKRREAEAALGVNATIDAFDFWFGRNTRDPGDMFWINRNGARQSAINVQLFLSRGEYERAAFWLNKTRSLAEKASTLANEYFESRTTAAGKDVRTFEYTQTASMVTLGILATVATAEAAAGTAGAPAGLIPAAFAQVAAVFARPSTCCPRPAPASTRWRTSSSPRR
jgi:hypothetical protein